MTLTDGVDVGVCLFSKWWIRLRQLLKIVRNCALVLIARHTCVCTFWWRHLMKKPFKDYFQPYPETRVVFALLLRYLCIQRTWHAYLCFMQRATPRSPVLLSAIPSFTTHTVIYFDMRFWDHILPYFIPNICMYLQLSSLPIYSRHLRKPSKNINLLSG